MFWQTLAVLKLRELLTETSSSLDTKQPWDVSVLSCNEETFSLPQSFISVIVSV
jgi:hypothetical protein